MLAPKGAFNFGSTVSLKRYPFKAISVVVNRYPFKTSTVDGVWFWMMPRLSDCWSVAAFRAMLRLGRRLFSAITGGFIAFATGLPAIRRMLRTSPKRSLSRCTGR